MLDLSGEVPETVDWEHADDGANKEWKAREVPRVVVNAMVRSHSMEPEGEDSIGSASLSGTVKVHMSPHGRATFDDLKISTDVGGVHALTFLATVTKMKSPRAPAESPATEGSYRAKTLVRVVAQPAAFRCEKTAPSTRHPARGFRVSNHKCPR